MEDTAYALVSALAEQAELQGRCEALEGTLERERATPTKEWQQQLSRSEKERDEARRNLRSMFGVVNELQQELDEVYHISATLSDVISVDHIIDSCRAQTPAVQKHRLLMRVPRSAAHTGVSYDGITEQYQLSTPTRMEQRLPSPPMRIEQHLSSSPTISEHRLSSSPTISEHRLPSPPTRSEQHLSSSPIRNKHSAAAPAPNPIRDAVTVVFDVIDTNKDGVISRAEFKDACDRGDIVVEDLGSPVGASQDLGSPAGASRSSIPASSKLGLDFVQALMERMGNQNDAQIEENKKEAPSSVSDSDATDGWIVGTEERRVGMEGAGMSNKKGRDEKGLADVNAERSQRATVVGTAMEPVASYDVLQQELRTLQMQQQLETSRSALLRGMIADLQGTQIDKLTNSNHSLAEESQIQALHNENQEASTSPNVVSPRLAAYRKAVEPLIERLKESDGLSAQKEQFVGRYTEEDAWFPVGTNPLKYGSPSSPTIRERVESARWFTRWN